MPWLHSASWRSSCPCELLQCSCLHHVTASYELLSCMSCSVNGIQVAITFFDSNSNWPSELLQCSCSHLCDQARRVKLLACEYTRTVAVHWQVSNCHCIMWPLGIGVLKINIKTRLHMRYLSSNEYFPECRVVCRGTRVTAGRVVAARPLCSMVQGSMNWQEISQLP